MPSPEKPLGADTTRYQLFERHASDPNAYATLQPWLETFERPHQGYIAYRRAMGEPVVVHDPVCAPGARDELLEAFCAHHPGAVFANITEPTGRTLCRVAPRRIGSRRSAPSGSWSWRGSIPTRSSRSGGRAGRRGARAGERRGWTGRG